MTDEPHTFASQHIGRFSDPATTALVIVDVQNDFAHEKGKAAALGADIKAAQGAVSAINHLVQEARRKEMHIVYLRIEHSPVTDRPNYRARYEQRGFDPNDLLCASDSWGADWYEQLSPPRPVDVVVTKYGYDGFQDTPLDAVLQSRGVRNLIITGLVTNLCVQTTAEHGFGLGYYIAIVGDAAAGDDEAAHAAALRNLGLYFGVIVESQKLVDLWRHTLQR